MLLRRREKAVRRRGSASAIVAPALSLLVNDHDPKPLNYQLQAVLAGEVAWQYVEQGRKDWQVRFGKKGRAGTGLSVTEVLPAGVACQFLLGRSESNSTSCNWARME